MVRSSLKVLIGILIATLVVQLSIGEIRNNYNDDDKTLNDILPMAGEAVSPLGTS